MDAKLTDGALQQLERILHSRTFQNSTRLRQFLKFLVEKTIANESHLLKETILGIEVFRRGADFDPKADPIVRVDARRLRAKLALYYQSEGATDSIRIVLQAGSYVPSFQTRAEERAAGEMRSIAVARFASLSPHPDDAYFSEGLTEEVLNALAQTRDVLVIAEKPAWHSSADQVVRGSVRRDGGRLRITVRLIAARDGAVAWSEQYDAEASDIFSTQENISRRIAIAIGTRIAPAQTLNTPPPGLHLLPAPTTLGMAS